MPDTTSLQLTVQANQILFVEADQVDPPVVIDAATVAEALRLLGEADKRLLEARGLLRQAFALLGQQGNRKRPWSNDQGLFCLLSF